MFGDFSSQATLRIFQIHYCQGDYGSCARYKSASQGIMPAANLLPDGSFLRSRTKLPTE